MLREKLKSMALRSDNNKIMYGIWSAAFLSWDSLRTCKKIQSCSVAKTYSIFQGDKTAGQE